MNGILFLEPTKILEIWTPFVKKLFPPDRFKVDTIEEENTGPTILKSEIDNAILSLENNKGPDNTHGEMKILCKMNNLGKLTITHVSKSPFGFRNKW